MRQPISTSGVIVPPRSKDAAQWVNPTFVSGNIEALKPTLAIRSTSKVASQATTSKLEWLDHEKHENPDAVIDVATGPQGLAQPADAEAMGSGSTPPSEPQLGLK